MSRDPIAECARFAERTMRHRFTGQIRTHAIRDGVVRVIQERAFGDFFFYEKGFDRSPRKALDWLRNAEEVQ